MIRHCCCCCIAYGTLMNDTSKYEVPVYRAAVYYCCCAMCERYSIVVVVAEFCSAACRGRQLERRSRICVISVSPCCTAAVCSFCCRTASRVLLLLLLFLKTLAGLYRKRPYASPPAVCRIICWYLFYRPGGGRRQRQQLSHSTAAGKKKW